MSDKIYKKLKKQNGEKFAKQLRNFHNGILEIPELDILLRYAGREARPLLPYLMHLLAVNDDNTASEQVPGDPFVLLDEAGYKAFHANTLEKQNSIKGYFQERELLCTFNDSSRYKNYHIVHAIKKDVDQIKREDFMGQEERQDAYGTSVISIQMLKTGGFISIKNRYNHAVAGCDNTFKSNPDNIIEGLSSALKDHFHVDFSASGSFLPEGYVATREHIFKYHEERNDIYYGDQCWLEDGKVEVVDKSSGDALFDGFLFDNETKTLQKIDSKYGDSFDDDFNRYYGGNPGLSVQDGNLTLNGEILIGAEKSRIKTLCLPEFKEMSGNSLSCAKSLISFEASGLIKMGENCLSDVPSLTKLKILRLETMGDNCFNSAQSLPIFYAPKLKTMGSDCLFIASALKRFDTPSLISMGKRCVFSAASLKYSSAPAQLAM